MQTPEHFVVIPQKGIGNSRYRRRAKRWRSSNHTAKLHIICQMPALIFFMKNQSRVSRHDARTSRTPGLRLALCGVAGAFCHSAFDPFFKFYGMENDHGHGYAEAELGGAHRVCFEKFVHKR